MLPKKCRILFVVKANAYGHGAAVLAREAQGRVFGFGVSSVEEGFHLRESGIQSPILVLGSLYPFESFEACVRHRLTPTVASLQGARALEKAAAKNPEPEPLPCHVKLETGMGRIGVREGSALKVLEFLSKAKGLFLEGLYSHLASADSDEEFTRLQMERFSKVCAAAESAGVSIPFRHIANSAAILRYRDSLWDMVRPGLLLYGLVRPCEPILAFKTQVVFVKTVPKGATVSYGRLWRAHQRRWIATLPVGYADGFARRLSNQGEVLIRGRRCPVVGAVTMDQTMVDVTSLQEKGIRDKGQGRRPAPVGVGEEVLLLGKQGSEEISAGELARKLGTISYEIVCGISSRVPRIYKRD